MKKIILVLALVLVLMLGAAVWFVWRAIGPSDAPSLLSDQTVAFMSFPNLAQSAIRWPQTALAKIGVEPEIKAFLEKPLQALGKNGGANEAGDILVKLKPSRIFCAAVTVSPQDASILVGFQFWGGKASHDEAVKQLRHTLAGGGPESEIMREVYENTEITGSIHHGTTLYSAAQGNWGFLTNNLNVLKETLDRATGRKKDGNLGQSERYHKAVAHLPKDPDFLVYVQTKPLLETLLQVGSGMGAQAIPQQLEQVRKMEAFAASIKLDGLDLRDSAFAVMQDPPDYGTLTHAAASLAGKDTIAYFDFMSALSDPATVKQTAAAAIAKFPALASTQIPTLVPEAFGPEFALLSSWSTQALRPTGILAIQVKDPAKAELCVQQAMSLYPDMAVNDQNGTKLYSFPALQKPSFNPTLALKDKFLFVGLDTPDLQSVLAGPAAEPMEKAPNFSLAAPAFHKTNQAFGYIDAKGIFERGYPMLRQVALFGAALMPGASDVVDTSKLPQTDTIAKHLNPIVYSQTRFADGFLVESSGPITLDQVLFLAAGLGAGYTYYFH